MRRPTRSGAAVLAVVALAGCSSRSQPVATEATTAPTAPPATTAAPAPAAVAPSPPTSPVAPPTPPTVAASAVAPAAVVHTEPWSGPSPPADAAALAAQLSRVEPALRDPATPPGAIAELALVQQVAYRQLGLHREWRADVVAAVPTAIRSEVDANAEAIIQLTDLGRAPRTQLPSWRIAAPLPAAELLTLYKQAAAAAGIGWEVLAAINLVETRMGRTVVGPAAPGQGPMQFEAGAWSRYGQGDIQSPHDAIFAAARLLAANGYARDPVAGIHHYNPRPNYEPAITALTAVLEADERSYLGYHDWQVFYRLQSGDLLLPEGWSNR